MDDFKQLNTNEIHSTQDFQSLTTIFRQYGKTISDLILYDSNKQLIQLSKLSGRSIREIEDYIEVLKADLSNQVPTTFIAEELNRYSPVKQSQYISTGLPTIDKQLGGNGIPLGDITEVFGASGCGKSHFLIQLAIQCQLRSEVKNQCIFIATESFLETKRLQDMYDYYREIEVQDQGSQISMDNVSYIYCPDLESQDHIIYTQLPIKLEQLKDKVNMVVIDSIAQHLRREGSINNSSYLKEKIDRLHDQLKDIREYQDIYKRHQQQSQKFQKKSSKYHNRFLKNHYLFLLNRHLYRLATKYNIAIVVVNQVSDFITPELEYWNQYRLEDVISPLNLDFQMGISSGWDPNVIFNSQQQQKFQLNSKDLELTNYELEKSINGGYSSYKRHQPDTVSSMNADPRYLRQNATKDVDADYNEQKDLLIKLHKLGNVRTKKVVPTLGYPWSMRVPNRIMLMKTYRPLMKDKEEWIKMNNKNRVVDPDSGLTYDQLIAGFDLHRENNTSVNTEIDGSSETIATNNQNQTIQGLIKGWQVERYAKVIYSRYNDNDTINDKVQFKITNNGVFEV
ncbi:P-loop containing nucleoside triphosphate hydrolase protein [Scheffersomyces amazonensis]|uniref:P-loop containing nucleoside triphosphate hydrolase protein n=1 Tax=Scheffersomyces amazonensis TaxID=1078765 RepID=UPI00315D9BF1